MLKNLFKKKQKVEKVDADKMVRDLNMQLIANNQKMLNEWNKMATAK